MKEESREQTRVSSREWGEDSWWGEGHVETIHAPRYPRLTAEPAARGRKTEQCMEPVVGEWCVSSQQIKPAVILGEGVCEEKQKQERACSSHRFCGEKVVSRAERQRMFLYTHPPLPLQDLEEPALGKYPQQCHVLLLFSSHGLGSPGNDGCHPGWSEKSGVPVPPLTVPRGSSLCWMAKQLP